MTPQARPVGLRGRHGRAAQAVLVYAVVALGLCSALVAWRDPAFAHDGAIVSSWASIVANAIPSTLLAMLLLALTRRPLLSLWLALGLLGMLYVANAVKLQVLDTPVLPADFVLLGHLGDGGSLLLRYLPHRAKAAVDGIDLAEHPVEP